MEVIGQLLAPDTLPLGESDPEPFGYQAEWAPESVWALRRREKFYTAGNRIRAVQPVARRYTD
jgi:hypothetical protein